MNGPMRVRRWLLLLGLAACLALSFANATAQDDSCRFFVEAALAELGWNCADTAAGAACYGHDFIAATFREENDFFNPVDRAPAADLLSLRSSPANISSGGWGIAQVNLPVDLGEDIAVDAQTGLTLILLGDAELIDLQFVPEFQPPQLTFRGGTQNTPCDEAINALILHSARGLLTTVALNGVQLDFDGSLLVHQPAVNIITFLVAEGQLVSQNLHTATGQALSILLDSEGVAQAYIPTRDASEYERSLFGVVELALAASRGEGPPLPATEVPPVEVPPEEEAAAPEESPPPAETADEETAPIEIDDEPAADEEARATNEAASTVSESGECEPNRLVNHTVASGETLFAIAQRYNSRVSDIVAANGIANVDLIKVGEQLSIPCASREPGETIMGSVPPVDSESDAACGAPGVGAVVAGEGMRTFSWSPFSGASRYVVSVWQGAIEIARYESAGPGTSLTGAIPSGAQPPYSWSLAALDGTELLCTSAAIPLDEGLGRRSAPPPPGPLSVSWSCAAAGEVTLVWENLPADTETLTISYRDEGSGHKQTLTVPGQSGRVVLAASYITDGVVTLAPGGRLVMLSPAELTCR